MSDLLPCPFCGSYAMEWEQESLMPWHFIKCVGCPACHISFAGDDRDVKWNRRAEVKP